MSVVEKLMALIAPPICLGCGREGKLICGGCTTVNLPVFGSRCYACSRLSDGHKTCQKCARFGGPGRVWISFTYMDTVEQLVELFKFGCSRQAGHFMASKMDQELPEQVMIAPIPTASSRVRQRGFDHTALLAREISARQKLEYRQVLRRVGSSRQVGSGRTMRLKQAKSSYTVINPAHVRGRHIVLIDDVVTTGATLQAAARLLRKAGAKKVDAVVFAKRQ